MWFLLVSSLARATTWTVDPSGGGDATTIEEGLALLSDGDTLEIAAGTYYEGDLDLEAHDVAIVGAGPELTVLDGSVGDPRIGLTIDTSVALSGIGFQNYDGYSYAIYGGDISIDEPIEVRIDDCVFESNAFALKLHEAYYGSYTVTNTRFLSNDFGIVGELGVYALIVEDSLFNDTPYGVFLQKGGYTFGIEFNEVRVAHNTFAGAELGVYLVPFPASSSRDMRMIIANNLFVDVATAWRLYEGYDVTGEIRGNLYGPGTVLENENEALVESDNTEADPDLVAWTDNDDWTDDDLHYVAGSPGVEAGVEGYATLDVDFDGVPRPQDGDCDGEALPDAGAYELASDADGDGACSASLGGDDCDDGDATVAPGAAETCDDGIDQDCDGGDPTCEDTGEPTETGDTGAPGDTGDTGTPADTSASPDTEAPEDTGTPAAGDSAGKPGGDPSTPGCTGCSYGRSPASPALLLLALTGLLRRRSSPRVKIVNGLGPTLARTGDPEHRNRRPTPLPLGRRPSHPLPRPGGGTFSPPLELRDAPEPPARG